MLAPTLRSPSHVVLSHHLLAPRLMMAYRFGFRGVGLIRGEKIRSMDNGKHMDLKSNEACS